MIQQGILTNSSAQTRTLYDEYAPLLLGYIQEVVKDKKLAEQYLIAVFNEVPEHLSELLQPQTNTFLALQLLTRKILANFFKTIPVCTTLTDYKRYLPDRPNKFLAGMTKEQQLIFCSIHYHGKSISALAAELNMSEDAIKKILQQAFAAIRRAA